MVAPVQLLHFEKSSAELKNNLWVKPLPGETLRNLRHYSTIVGADILRKPL